jgi:hypothetical protein
VRQKAPQQNFYLKLKKSKLMYKRKEKDMYKKLKEKGSKAET